jgi:CspA family cold shock protein
MPTGRIRTFDAARGFGFVVAEDGDEYYVGRDGVAGDQPHPGDEVSFEVVEDAPPGKRAATAVTVTRSAPAGSPVGRTMAPPPSWDALEDRERQRRMARRRRR